jgi:predicted GNAT family acetyltransferase
MAAVVQRTRDKGHSTVSLYANDYNETALRMYARVGFEQVGTFATVMY